MAAPCTCLVRLGTFTFVDIEPCACLVRLGALTFVDIVIDLVVRYRGGGRSSGGDREASIEGSKGYSSISPEVRVVNERATDEQK